MHEKAQYKFTTLANLLNVSSNAILHTLLSVPFIFVSNNLMMKLLPLRFATVGIKIILSLIIIFHLLVISRIIPFDLVWGGNIPDKNKLWLMESISIAINLLMLLFVCAYSGIIRMKINSIVIKVGFWIMFALFVLNTLGNILSK